MQKPRGLIFILCICAALSGVAQTLSEQVDSLPSSVTLQELEVTVGRRVPALDIDKERGKFILGAEALGGMNQILGAPDALRTMQTLPYVTSNDCLSGGMYVQGSENAHNLVRIDGVPIYNPMHLLGLFSVFNTPHFESFDISFGKDFAISPNFVGADIEANTTWRHPERVMGDISVGIIDSRGTLKVPMVRDKASLAVSGRGTYVNALFGNAIKVENAPLKYGFTDFNLTYLQSLGRDWKLKVVGYYGRDHMNLRDPNYASDISMGWDNLVVGISARQSDRQLHTLGLSRFANNVDIKYTDIDKRMPSDIYSLCYSGDLRLGMARIGMGANYRHATPQGSGSADATSLFARNSFDVYAGGIVDIPIKERLQVTPGCKLAFYAAGDFARVYLLPSLTVSYKIQDNHTLEAGVSRRAQFVHKIEESTIGLPTDFWVAADKRLKPCTSVDFSVSAQGKLLEGKLMYYIGGYYRIFNNLTDWMGNFFSMLNPDYEPMRDIISGKGRAIGVATMLQAKIGPVTGWVSYTLSRSQQQFPDLGNKWHPYSHDRTHDLKINLSWRIISGLTASASFVYATGYPYTEPLLGYMVGENLILEFKDHNSSRLPAMHRLDLGLNWCFWTRGRVSQSINIGVFNVYCHRNVMFRSFKYSPDKGIHPTSWSMDYILPGISYNIRF